MGEQVLQPTNCSVKGCTEWGYKKFDNLVFCASCLNFILTGKRGQSTLEKNTMINLYLK